MSHTWSHGSNRPSLSCRRNRIVLFQESCQSCSREGKPARYGMRDTEYSALVISIIEVSTKWLCVWYCASYENVGFFCLQISVWRCGWRKQLRARSSPWFTRTVLKIRWGVNHQQHWTVTVAPTYPLLQHSLLNFALLSNLFRQLSCFILYWYADLFLLVTFW